MKFNPKARSRARSSALQALYQWQITGHTIKDIEIQFHQEQNMQKLEVEYFHELLHTVPSMLNDLDEQMQEYLERPIQEVSPIELMVLRIGVYELIKRIDIPYRVVLNESIELAKKFGNVDSHKFVNSVLDQVAQKHRHIETEQDQAD